MAKLVYSIVVPDPDGPYYHSTKLQQTLICEDTLYISTEKPTKEQPRLLVIGNYSLVLDDCDEKLIIDICIRENKV